MTTTPYPRAAVLHDGRAVALCADDNQAFAWLLRHQGQSVSWAVTHEGYAIVPVEPWPADETERMSRNARAQFTDDWHASGGCRREGRLGRENCGPCCLAGYRPRGGFEDPEADAPGAGPNHAGWARLYVEARVLIPAKWRAAFAAELAQSDPEWANIPYAYALARSIATYGVKFG